MAKSYIRVTAVGNVGRPPELTSAGDNQIAKWSMAINEAKKVGGDWVENTTWLNCIAWGRTAEIICERVNKGDLLMVSGPLKSNDWTDKEGNKRTSYEVTVRDFVTMRLDKAADRPKSDYQGSQSGSGGGYGGYGGKGNQSFKDNWQSTSDTAGSFNDSFDSVGDSDLPF